MAFLTPSGRGPAGRVVIEVLAQRDARHVRGIALIPTQGLARGTSVEDTGSPLKAPVGKGTLSRMFDVFGNTMDRGGPLSDVEWRSVHRAPPPSSGAPRRARSSMASRPGKHRVWAVGERVHAHVTELHLFYNHLTASAAAHEPFDLRLLPLDEAWRRELVRLPWPTKLPPEVLGDASSALRALIREHLYITLFRACAESLASENASRLAAMQRAEKNIDELLETLHGSFHHLRQSSIDEELFDVIAGFEALKRGPRRAAAPTAPPGYKGPFLE